MKDNIGHEVHIGDRVFCLGGSKKNTIQIIARFRTISEYWGTREAVDFESGGWLSAYNVISLNALDVSAYETVSRSGYDALGNPLRIGDKVLFLHAMEMYAEIGTVKKLSSKSCLLSIAENRFGQTEYRKKFEELISLTAISKEDLIIQHCHD